jgi:methylamine dehydrogenase accessory protein MauD
MVNAGLEIGVAAPPLKTTDIQGMAMTLGSERDKPTLLLFITPSCSTCVALAPALRALRQSERAHLDLALVSMYSNDDEARQFVTKYKLKQIPVTTSPSVGFDYQVTSPPFAMLIDRQGTVRAKGIINNSEHLESLLNVLDVGHESLEKWYKEQKSAELDIATNMTVQ